jgi:hypothetical protein
VTDQTAYVEVLARLLCAADVHVHDGDHPSWQQLRVAQHGRGQDDYRKAARWLAARLTVTDQPPAAPAVQAPATDQTALRDRIAEALAREDAHNTGYDHGFAASYGADDETDGFVDAVLAVLPAPTDQAAELTEVERKMLEYALALAQDKIWSLDGFTDEDQAAVHSLRRMADKTQPTQAKPATPMTEPRLFHLQRDHDVSGVSGTGRVANGVLWPDGTVSLRWIGERPSTVHWDRLDDAEHVHGHGGATRIVWADEQPPADRAAVLREAAEALGRMDYDTDSNDYGYATYRDAWNGGVMDGAGLLRRMADETQPTETDDPRAALERVRERCQAVRDRVGPGGMINASQILGLLSPTWPDGNFEASEPAPGARQDEEA